MPTAIQLFPKAKVWGASGLEKKRKDIAWTNSLTVDSWPYKEFLDVLQLNGAPHLNEVEFFYRPTKTLITTDLCFNMHRPSGWAAGLVLRAFGTYDGFASSRLLKILVKDKTAFERSLASIFDWDFNGVIMSHGEVILKDGKQKLRQALNARGFHFGD